MRYMLLFSVAVIYKINKISVFFFLKNKRYCLNAHILREKYADLISLNVLNLEILGCCMEI